MRTSSQIEAEDKVSKYMGKLVRNKIPEIIRADGQEPITRVLNETEYISELGKKAVEEASEVAQAKESDEILAELADLEEVKLALLQAIGRTPAELESVRQQKAQERGSFTERIYWEGNQ